MRKKKYYHMLASFPGPSLQREDRCLLFVHVRNFAIRYIITCKYMFHVIINIGMALLMSDLLFAKAILYSISV